MRHRFEPILVPDESWMVFDVLLGGPAEFNGRCLIGLAPDECGELARLLNDRAARSTEEVRPWTN